MTSIYDPVFKGLFLVSVGPFSEVERHMRRLGLDAKQMSAPRMAKTVWLEHPDGRDSCVLWFGPEAKGRPSVVAHEVHHAAWFTLEARGVSADTFTGEVGAYYMEWLMVNVLAACSRAWGWNASKVSRKQARAPRLGKSRTKGR